jgi:hypothetical protein
MSDNIRPDFVPQRIKKAGEYKKNRFGEDILCKLSTELTNCSKELPVVTKDDLCKQGTPLAGSGGMGPGNEVAVNPISNAPALQEPVDSDLPNEYQFEIYRLRRRVMELECVVRDRDERIVRALSIIEDEIQFWRTGMYQHVWETMSGIARRMLRLESTIAYLKDKASHVWPELEIPARWKSDKNR